MTDNAARMAQLSELLREHQNARDITANPAWGKLWDAFEQELLERLLACGPTEDDKRWRCQTSIEAARRIRRIFESKAVTPAQLETELAYLDGSKLRPVA